MELTSFRGVDTWLFDLDNTLYPRHCDLFAQVDVRIRDFVSCLLDMPADDAHRLQKSYYKEYGTTLRGLMIEHGIEPDEFLEYVHDIDHSPVKPDPALAKAIEALPGRKFIFTNGTVAHAEAVANRLGVTDHFEEIFDIVWADLIPKPHRVVYDRLAEETGLDPKRTAMFEDLSRNLEVPHDMGMRTVLLVPEHTREVFHEEWEAEGRNAPHIQFVTDNLAGFLQSVLAEL
ncbi:pyrimidine 5'-nucleotidase [Coralliovum pocilloporae]|uniref:pyrimidine 5'-nucleotidase n=1 Tax=Coralliovum pocilloporae TaxID=3066369 RepID=UPI003307A237